jgi:hypothetical protein
VKGQRQNEEENNVKEIGRNRNRRRRKNNIAP